MNRIKNIVAISLFLFLFSCAEKEKCIPMEYFSNGGVKLCLRDSLSKATGKSCYRIYYSNGNISTEFCMENDLASGEALSYRVDGSIRFRGHFSKGKQNGNFTFFCEGGAVEKYSYWVDGDMVYSNNFGCPNDESHEKFFPIFNFLSDTITERISSLKFSVSMPLPDSIKKGRKFYFVFGLSDVKFRDSLILQNNKELELGSKNVSIGELSLTKRDEQHFFGYVLDKNNKHVYYPFDKKILFKEGIGYIISSPYVNFLE